MNKLTLVLVASIFFSSGPLLAQSLEQAVAKVLTEHPQLQSSFNQFKASSERYQ